MSFAIHGIAVARGIAIGRAVMAASSHLDVTHYLIEAEQTEHEIDRVRVARKAVVEELQHLRGAMGSDVPQEMGPLLDVHLMLAQDDMLSAGVRALITERFYNAEWALTAQLELLCRQFDEMDDEYLRERKGDLQQVVERVLRHMRGVSSPVAAPASAALVADPAHSPQGELIDKRDAPMVLIANDLSPADMLQFKKSVFAGFVTAVGGKTSHTAIVARSMDIPAVVGARTASQLIRADDWVIIDGDAGEVIVDPSPILLEEYRFKQRQMRLERERLSRLRDTPSITQDGERVELLANIEQPGDSPAAVRAGAVGVGLFRTEFLFMGRGGKLPDEEEQYRAYREALEGMQGMPVTIRTLDVGADKPLDKAQTKDYHLNPALGLRAIRFSLADPDMFRTQLRAILRAALHGPVQLLFPMLAHLSEIKQTLAQVEQASQELREQGIPQGHVKMGAMVEIPAAALTMRTFLRYFDFVSIGTNDLIQYTLAIDRADEAVAHLYDPLHPAVLRLIAEVISAANAQGKEVCVCGEMAGDATLTKLLLGLGLRSFSMQPAQILAIKQEVLRADTQQLAAWAQRVIESENPAELLES